MLASLPLLLNEANVETVDASVGDVANIGAVENIKHHEANNDDDNDVVNAPIEQRNPIRYVICQGDKF